MTTLRQVKRLLTPLLDRHDDLALVGRWLFVKPVHHVLRGILVERITNADRFRAWWAVTHLCEPMERFPLNWAVGIRPTKQWYWDNPSLQSELCDAVEEQALPALRAIRTLDDFVAFASSAERFSLTRLDADLVRKVPIDIGRAEFAGALTACAQLATGRTRFSAPTMREEFIRIHGTLCPLLATNDRSGMARLLHEWEAYTVNQLKIVHIFEPTPFPLEVEAEGRAN